MIVTKEQQEALVDNYINQGHTSDEVSGFIDGVIKAIELIATIDKRKRQG